MTSHIDFKKCYKSLGLTPEADWQQVQSKYRQLLIRWHPDRHRHNKTLHEHATQHFITLTAAFNELRDYQRTHNRLPLQAETEMGSQAGVAADLNAQPTTSTNLNPENTTSKASGAANKSKTAGNSTFSKVSSAVAPRTVSGVERTGQTKESQKAHQTTKRSKAKSAPFTHPLNLSDEQLQDASLVKTNTRPGLKESFSYWRSKPSFVMLAAIVGLLVFGILLVFVLDITGSQMRRNQANRIVIENGNSAPVQQQAEELVSGSSSVKQ